MLKEVILSLCSTLARHVWKAASSFGDKAPQYRRDLAILQQVQQRSAKDNEGTRASHRRG